jgi:hypothetical protein
MPTRLTRWSPWAAFLALSAAAAADEVPWKERYQLTISPWFGPQADAGSANGTNLAPGTYSGWIRFRSDDSGEPPYELTRKVYFDHCREIFEAAVGPPTAGRPTCSSATAKPGRNSYNSWPPTEPLATRSGTRSRSTATPW